jgi:hypothetical protein
MQRIMKKKITEDYIEVLGQEAWDSMTDVEKVQTIRVHLVTCQNHLRSTMISWGVKAENKLMKEVLDRTLAHIDPSIRVFLGTQQICRAATKEFQFSGQDLYAKGKVSLHFFSVGPSTNAHTASCTCSTSPTSARASTRQQSPPLPCT